MISQEKRHNIDIVIRLSRDILPERKLHYFVYSICILSAYAVAGIWQSTVINTSISCPVVSDDQHLQILGARP